MAFITVPVRRASPGRVLGQLLAVSHSPTHIGTWPSQGARRQNGPVHSADFFEARRPSPFGSDARPAVLNVDLLQRLTRGPLSNETDMSAAEGLFDLVEHDLR